MLHVTQHSALQAAFISNLLYGGLIVLPARARAAMAPGDAPWVLGTGAFGHMIHAVTAPSVDVQLVRDIGLVFAALWVGVISAPLLVSATAAVGHMVIDF